MLYLSYEYFRGRDSITIRERLMHTKSVMMLTPSAIAAVLLIGAGAALLLLEGGKQRMADFV